MPTLQRKKRTATKRKYTRKQHGGVVPYEADLREVISIPLLKSILKTLGFTKGTKNKPGEFDDKKLEEDLSPIGVAINTASSLESKQMCDILSKTLYKKGMDATYSDRKVINGSANEHLRKSLRYKSFVDRVCFYRPVDLNPVQLSTSAYAKPITSGATANEAAEAAAVKPFEKYSESSNSSQGSVASFVSLSDPIYANPPESKKAKKILRNKLPNTALPEYNKLIHLSSNSTEEFKNWKIQHAKSVANANKKNTKPNAANMAEPRKLKRSGTKKINWNI
jgi:hypothetical protein